MKPADRSAMNWAFSLVTFLIFISSATAFTSGPDSSASPVRVIRTLKGHTQVVMSVAYSPDGRAIASTASGHSGGEVIVWEADTGEVRWKWMPPPIGNRIRSLAFSRDGKKLYGRTAGSFAIWNAANGMLERMERVPGEENSEIAIAPRKNLIATAHNDGYDERSTSQIKIWNMTTWRLKSSFDCPRADQYGLAFSPDGRTLAGAMRRDLMLWNAETGNIKWRRRAHRSMTQTVAFSPDGKSIATGSTEVRLWDAGTGEWRQTLHGDGDFVFALRFTLDGKSLISGGGMVSEKGHLRIWNCVTGHLLYSATDHTDAVESLALSPCGKMMASASADRTVKVWDLSRLSTSGFPLDEKPWLGHTKSVTTLAFSPDGKTLASGSRDESIILWDVRSARPRRTLRGHSDVVNSVAFVSPDQVASGSDDTTVRVWNTKEGRTTAVLDGHSNAVLSVAVSPTRRILASSSGVYRKSGEVFIWSATTGELLHRITGHENYVSSVSFSPDGEVLASADWDGKVMLSDPNSGQTIMTFHADNSVGCVAFAPSGATVATSGRGLERSVKLWDARTGHLLRVMKREFYSVESIAFSPDGRTLASGCHLEINIWESETGMLLRTLRDQESVMYAVVFSPDGSTIASSASIVEIRERQKEYRSVVKLHDTASWELKAVLPGGSPN